MSAMLIFINAIRRALDFQQNREDAYLALAVDNYDLERRMREIDRGRRFG